MGTKARRKSVTQRPTAAKTRKASAARSSAGVNAETKAKTARIRAKKADAKVNKLKAGQFISEKRLEAQVFDAGKLIKGKRKLPPAAVKAADRVIKQLRKTTKAKIKFIKRKAKK